MTTTTLAPPVPPAPPTAQPDTVADLIARLGGIPPARIRMRPAPGTATEQDVLDAEARGNRLCELVDGTLVEKPMSYRESLLAIFIAAMLDAFVRPRNLGLVSGADGMMRLFPGLVRIPDVAFASWSRVPGGRVPTEPVPGLVPDLAVEVLSESNTVAEMERKRGEYFQAGVRLVWMVDPDSRTVAVYTSVGAPQIVDVTRPLDGAAVLPGFTLSVAELFAQLDRQATP